MLQSIRNNTQSLFAKILVGVIVLVFALWGVDAIVGGFNGEKPAATVNGEDIAEVNLQRAIELKKRELYSRFGEGFDPSLIDDNLIRNAALEELIGREIIASDASAQGVSFSDQALDKMIVNAPTFQVDGKFSQEAFDSAIRSLGYTRVGFREMAREDMMIGQVRGALSSTAFVTEREAKRLTALEQQRRDYAYTTISRSSMDDKVELSDEQIETYYQDNAQNYKTEEQVKVEYITVSLDDYTAGVEVNEEDLKALYDESVREMEVTEERKASHILVAVDDEVSEEAAIAKISDLKARIDAGESFEDLAKEFSDDPGSAQQGGDLGFAGTGTYVEPFEDALFALNEGQMSEPVVTTFGVHLIKLTDLRTQNIPTFEEMKPRLEQELRVSEAKTAFVAAGEELANSAFSADTLAEVASELSLEVVTTDYITREGGADQVTSNAQIINQIFNEEFIADARTSDLIELSDEQSVVIRVIDHIVPEVKSLEEVKEQVVSALTSELAQQKARDAAEALLKELREGKALEDFTEVPGLSWSVIESAGRTTDSVNAAINNKAFTIGASESGSFDRVSLGNGDVVVIRLDQIIEAEQLDEEEIKSTLQLQGNQAARLDYQAYQQSLRARAEIER
ncbi:SurA N-terminal domain-containing protein [Litoribacillus peritrichatus]|uniref:Periplasmic chaperone PpiD n=1 Tax=Litoribacillus peritrichatus TaxID=718191 RepID=A0ABP7M7L9_9GAMM